MKKVLVFGTFDLLHPGHISLFRQAKKHGGHLTVIVARDKTVKEVKGRPTKIKEKTRLRHVSGIPEVDKALLGNKRDKYSIIKRISPDIICLGYDQSSFTKDLRKELKARDIKAKIIRLKPYKAHKYKSSKLRN